MIKEDMQVMKKICSVVFSLLMTISIFNLFSAMALPISDGTSAAGIVPVFHIGNINPATVTGELQFTEYGLSGICVYNLSRLVGELLTCGTVRGQKACVLSLHADLLPQYAPDAGYKLLQERQKKLENLELDSFLGGMFSKRIGQVLVKSVYNGPMTDPCSILSGKALGRLAGYIKDWSFTPTALPSWQRAQVTAGGIPAGELKATMESRKVNGLYMAGELVDVDGDCGGFNLQWAWSSGYLAGQSAAASLVREDRG